MFGAHGSATPGHSRPHSRPLRLTNYAPKSQTILPANFYPSNNTLIQALLVLLITNMISMGKTWSGLLKLCAASSSSPPLSKLSPLSAEAYSPPAQPRPNLNAVPHICTKMTLGCAFKAATKVAPSFASRRLPLPPAAYISLHCTVTPTAPPDCSQTRLKTDQQTTPQTDSVYLSEQPHQNCETS